MHRMRNRWIIECPKRRAIASYTIHRGNGGVGEWGGEGAGDVIYTKVQNSA